MSENKTTNSQSEQQLILQNMGSIVAQARRFKPNAVTDIDDYRQEGAIALLKAIRKYNPEKGKLNTYAWPAMFRAICRHSQKFGKKTADGQQQTVSLEFDPIQEVDPNLIKDLLPELQEDELDLLALRLAGYTLEEIGQMYGKHKQSIRIQLERICKRVQKAND